MENNRIDSQSQADIQIQSKIDSFFIQFRIGTLLHRCGIRKCHGYSIRSLIQIIFALPFTGKNFYRGIVINEDADAGKNAAYAFLKCPNYNWRQLLLILGLRVYSVFNRLTSEEREQVLIFDDSPYDHSRSKKVELLSRVFDHCSGRF